MQYLPGVPEKLDWMAFASSFEMAIARGALHDGLGAGAEEAEGVVDEEDDVEDCEEDVELCDVVLVERVVGEGVPVGVPEELDELLLLDGPGQDPPF